MKDIKNNKLPEFLIVGAAKSGTTSLYNYLNDFDDVFMPDLKEPKYITSTFLKSPFQGKGDLEVNRGITKSYEDYCNLFKGANEDQLKGEASADNLYYYEKSIPKIKETLGQPKIIILLRNPINRAFSAYMHLRRDLRETMDFREAIGKESQRINNNFEFIWHYLAVGNYYEQVKAFKENFKDVKIILFDDLKSQPIKIIEEVRTFLGLEKKEYHQKAVEKFNQSGEPRYPKLKKSVLKLREKGIRKIIPPALRKIIREKVFTLDRTVMQNEDKEYLKNYYKDEIFKLENFINRDLSHWLK